jgi:hypothetical protein
MLSDTNIAGNTASDGGGIDDFGTLTVREYTLSGNTASFGGGIANYVTLTLLDSTLLGNTGLFGGDLFELLGAPVSIIDSIIGNRYDG